MAKRIARVAVKVKTIPDAERAELIRTAREVLPGIIASRGQYPLEMLKAEADKIADVAVVIAQALHKRVREGA